MKKDQPSSDNDYVICLRKGEPMRVHKQIIRWRKKMKKLKALEEKREVLAEKKEEILNVLEPRRLLKTNLFFGGDDE
jgi:hypothetical protein